MLTSYFGNREAWNGNGIAICQGVPRNWKGRRYLPLAPSWALVKAKLPDAEWEARYRAEVLAKLDPAKVYADLGENALMLCWEAPGKACHRHQVARWLEEALGVKIGEHPGVV